MALLFLFYFQLYFFYLKGVQNLKDRLSIQLDPDIRNGKVRFDGWVLPAKVVDLPTIIESHKTLDNKNFYKTADICQMMICKEEVDEVKPEESEEIKKTKDGLCSFCIGQVVLFLQQLMKLIL